MCMYTCRDLSISCDPVRDQTYRSPHPNEYHKVSWCSLHLPIGLILSVSAISYIGGSKETIGAFVQLLEVLCSYGM